MPTAYTYSDMDKGLSISKEGNVKVLYDEDAILQSIRIIMATVQGERVRNDIGGSLIRILFQPMDEIVADNISTFLQDMIDFYEPRVTVADISVTPNYDKNYYEVNMMLTINRINKRLPFSTRLRSLSNI